MEVRVLIVDASPSVAQATAGVLEQRGFQTVVATSCEDACGRPGPFDCGIFSADLPDGNGVSLAGWLLAEDRVYSVVFFDPASDPELGERMGNLGVVVPRSEGLDALCDALRNLLVAVGERARAVGAADGPHPSRHDQKSGRRRKRFD